MRLKFHYFLFLSNVLQQAKGVALCQALLLLYAVACFCVMFLSSDCLVTYILAAVFGEFIQLMKQEKVKA